MTIWTLEGWQAITFVSEAVVRSGWSHPALMQLRERWAVLLIVPDPEGERLWRG